VLEPIEGCPLPNSHEAAKKNIDEMLGEKFGDDVLPTPESVFDIETLQDVAFGHVTSVCIGMLMKEFLRTAFQASKFTCKFPGETLRDMSFGQFLEKITIDLRNSVRADLKRLPQFAKSFVHHKESQFAVFGTTFSSLKEGILIEPDQVPEIEVELLTFHKPVHSPDFHSVNWFGTVHVFSKLQADIVRILWENWENGTPAVGLDYIKTHSGSDSDKLASLFKKHSAWKTMIVERGKGVYALQEPPDADK
jgi:hypothetical protein